jgi:hypothetical protein
MNDQISPDIAALYRAGATEEPDASLDAAILRAARRGRQPRLTFTILTVLLLATTMIALRPEKPSQLTLAPVVAEASVPPGMADGRGRLLAIDAQPQRIGLNVRPLQN